LFPDDLEARLSEIAEAAVREGIDPVLDLPNAAQAAKVMSVMTRSFAAFLEQRRKVWPPIIGHVTKHPLVVLQLLREMTELATIARVQVPLPALNDDDADGRSLVRLRLALRTYELSLHLFLSSMPRALSALATRGAPAELANASALESFLQSVDTATARLEFGVLVGLRLLERKRRSLGPRFELASEYAQSGADEQHVLLRGALRAVVGTAPGYPAAVPGGEGAEDATPQEALFADWVRAVLAA